MLNTYLYFSEDGTLKEQIQAPVRAGGTNTNAIFVYWEGVNNTVSTVTVDYKDGVSGRVFDNHYVPTVPPVDPNPNCIIPFDSKRDLKYFKYYTQYNFYVFNIPAELLAGDDHPIVFDFKFVYTGGEIVLGLSSVWCQGQAVKADQLITIAQWNYLTTQLTQYITAAEVANLYVTKIDPTSSGLMTHTGDGYFTGDLGTDGDLIVDQDFKIEKDGSDFKVSVDGGEFKYKNSEVANEDYVDDNILDMTSNPMTLTDEQYAYASKANVRVRQTLNDGSKRLFDKAYETDTTFVFVCSRDEQIIPAGQDYKQRNLPMAILTKSTKVLATGNLSYNFYDKSQTDSKFGHSIEASVNTTNYVMTMTLKDANGNVLNTASVDLPLESIIVSAQYYATYTYDGTTYTNVIVITLATTSVPTIVPLGTLVSGLVDLTSNQNITGYKTFKYKITWQSPNGTYSSELRQADGGNFDFYLNGSVKLRYSYTNSNWDCFLDFVPHSNNTYNLGGASNVWKDIFVKNIKDGNGSEVETNNIAKDNAVVHLTGDETIDGNKKFSNAVLFGASDAFITSDATYKYVIGYVSGGSQINLLRYRLGYGTYVNGAIMPMTSGGMDLGSSASYWRDLYLTGKWKDGTNEKSLQDLLDENASLQYQINQLKEEFYETTIDIQSYEYQYLLTDTIPLLINSKNVVESIGMDCVDVKGNSYVYNQKVQNGNFVNGDNWSAAQYYNTTRTYANNEVQLTANNTGCDIRQTPMSIINGHKYFICLTAKVDAVIEGLTFNFGGRFSGVENDNFSNFGVLTTSYQFFSQLKTTGSANTRFDLYVNNLNNANSAYLKQVQIFDLTQLGIDSVSTTDQAIAELMKLGINPYEYNSYNEGKIVNSKPTKLISGGFNLWDETWFNGYWNANTGVKTPSGTYVACNDYISVRPNTKYYITAGTGSYYRNILAYDKNKNFLGRFASPTTNRDFTTPNNCYFITFYFPAEYGDTYKNDVCISIFNASLNGTYRPYIAPTEYALDLPILRGVGTAQDDKEKVRIGVIDLGSLSWAYDSDNNLFYSQISSKKTTNNLMCYMYSTTTNTLATMPNMSIRGNAGATVVYVKNESYNDEAQFKTAMSGIYLLYELATPTDQPTITLPENIAIQKGGTITAEYDSTDNAPSDFDFELGTSNIQ